MPQERLEWYFDVVSPYAYFQSYRLRALAARFDLVLRPVLFAGLLNHWGQLGPAEIPQKRVFTYEYAVWRAARLGVPLVLPKAHPFNPLRLLRLAVAAKSTLDAVEAIFRFVWAEGEIGDDDGALTRLGERIGVADALNAISAPEVKATLTENGVQAVAKGVFGVPTFVTQANELYWGDDATEMMLDRLHGAAVFESAQMQRAKNMPAAAQRPESRLEKKP